MKIEFPLLSILSLSILLFFGLQGNVEIYSLELRVSISSSEAQVMIDPTFAIWVPQSVVYSIGCNAFAFGNIMVLDEQGRGNNRGDYLLAHESNHIEQHRALGLFAWPARFFIDIEPPKDMETNWDDPGQCDRTMWLPPSWWVSQWHFLSISLSSSL